MRRIDALNSARIAIEAGRRKLQGYSDWIWSPTDESRLHEQLTALETIGLIKFDEPLPKTHTVPALSYLDHCGRLSALVREDTLIETLRMAGYKVEPATPYQFQK